MRGRPGWSSLRRCGPYGKDRGIRGRIPCDIAPARRCRSSVVEHSLGKGEVVSSILTGSTTNSPSIGGSDLADMNDRPKNAEKTRRQQRLGRALRENLKRRKAQAKGRSPSTGHAETPHDSAGFDPDKQKS